MRVKRIPITAPIPMGYRVTNDTVAVRPYDLEEAHGRYDYHESRYIVGLVVAGGRVGLGNRYVVNKELDVGAPGIVALGSRIVGLRRAIEVAHRFAKKHNVADLWIFSNRYRKRQKNMGPPWCNTGSTVWFTDCP